MVPVMTLPLMLPVISRSPSEWSWPSSAVPGASYLAAGFTGAGAATGVG